MRLYIYFLFGILFSTATCADVVYIHDQLRVGVRPEPDNKAAPLTVVVTGAKLEVLDTASGYLKVRTAGGVEGWVKDIYTTQDVPAVVQLKELTQNSTGSNTKIATLKKKVSIIEGANRVLTEELENIKSEKSMIQMELVSLKGQRPGQNVFYWVLAILFTVILGFLLGMFWYRYQAMKRLGGLKL